MVEMREERGTIEGRVERRVVGMELLGKGKICTRAVEVEL